MMASEDVHARIQAAVAQALEERRAADAARLEAARKRRGARDGQGSGPLPLGYRRVWDGLEDSGRTGRIVVVEEQATIVRRIFELRDTQGASIRDIAMTLWEEGVRTSKGGNFTASSIQQILAHRELYTTGKRYYAGVEAHETWPTILA